MTTDTTAPSAPSDADRTGRRQHGQPELDRVDRQRRRRALQRPPRHDRRLHAERGEPDRAADRHELRGQRARDRHLLLQGDRRGRGRQRQRCLERDQRDGRRRVAHRPRRPGSTASAVGSTVSARLDGRDRQRRRRPLQRPPRHDVRLHAHRRRTGSRSRPARATRTTASRRAPTSTRSPPRTPPATSAPSRTPPARPLPTRSLRAPRRASRRPAAQARQRSTGRRQPTTSACCATTSIARRPPALHPRRQTGSRSRQEPATRTRASRPVPTSSRSPPRTPPATSVPRPTRPYAIVTTPAVTGLVGAYGFDAGTGTTDRSTSPATGTRGTLTNTTWSTTGKFGNALSFNGTNVLGHRRGLELARPDEPG